MKLLLRQYLASLKERDELDVVLPDIMSEVGYTVISRPKLGTTQYGVDVAAVGPHPKSGKKALFLLSIKAGDLTRNDWSNGAQALRHSLEEIVEVYVPRHIPNRYKHLPIIVALCVGGDIQEDVRIRVDGFIDKNTQSEKLEFAEWNGDHIATLIATGLLRENIFPKVMQTSFRKSASLVDEPSVCVSHFDNLLRYLIEVEPKKLTDRLRIARQIYLATWTIFVWCRDAENLEAAYRVSELATLHTWNLCHPHFGPTKTAKALTDVTGKMTQLSRTIAAAFIERHVEPYCAVEDGLGVSVPTAASVDINLKLFEVLGRVAISGLWLIQTKSFMPDNVDSDYAAALNAELNEHLHMICGMINNNQALSTPLRDDHAIEITLTGLFLMQCRAYSFMNNWVNQIILSSIFSHQSNAQYPCIFREYADLAMHPKSIEGYKQEATVGSILYPTLGVWLAMFNDTDSFRHLAEFHTKQMAHSTWQLWIPDETSEERLYVNSAAHGSCITHLTTFDGPETLLEQVNKEVVACSEFYNLSAVKYGQWPIVLMACHIYRLPVPPHFWTMSLLPAEAEPTASDDSTT